MAGALPAALAPLLLIVANGAAPDTVETMHYDAYMVTRGPGDPDPALYMRKLIAYARANRNKSVSACASQNPPVPPSQCPGGVPFCASVVNRSSGDVVVTACNRALANPVLHGEIAAINAFADVVSGRGGNIYVEAPMHDLYTTGESCAMCMGAIMWTGFHTLFFGSSVDHLNHYFNQIRYRDAEMAARWQPCNASAMVKRTSVVGSVLATECDALFEEYGPQLCAHPGHHSHGHEHTHTHSHSHLHSHSYPH